jgi:hypothetical protein
MLLNFSGQELPETSRSEVNLSDPIVALLSQSRSFRICRRETFSPVEGCAHQREIRTIGKLALHVRRDHSATSEDTLDMFVHFLRQMLPHKVRRVVMAANGRGLEGTEMVSAVTTRAAILSIPLPLRCRVMSRDCTRGWQGT